jgi:hypothetical protein
MTSGRGGEFLSNDVVRLFLLAFLCQIHFILWNFAVRQITFTQFTWFNSALHQFDFSESHSDYACPRGYFLGSYI